MASTQTCVPDRRTCCSAQVSCQQQNTASQLDRAAVQTRWLLHFHHGSRGGVAGLGARVSRLAMKGLSHCCSQLCHSSCPPSRLAPLSTIEWHSQRLIPLLPLRAAASPRFIPLHRPQTRRCTRSSRRRRLSLGFVRHSRTPCKSTSPGFCVPPATTSPTAPSLPRFYLRTKKNTTLCLLFLLSSLDSTLSSLPCPLLASAAG
ncbi:uncharacterized protein EI97DRAFT_103629 [Westerdykella ornata]|uniref:Uncharacterized protein n=1 Tax=Westerdykella ornata TaxID=318751 RepID=A0A6A6JH86_WESOR|nr:uncharacterized protein EI97DRAFT_103629 [Westerdykella ornata]KAF2274599.1 hypothetical protein EI97DRAFT_103629 [Westerdykella ornata]